MKRLQIFTITRGALCVELVSLKCLVFTLKFKGALVLGGILWSDNGIYFTLDHFTGDFSLPVCIIFIVIETFLIKTEFTTEFTNRIYNGYMLFEACHVFVVIA